MLTASTTNNSFKTNRHSQISVLVGSSLSGYSSICENNEVLLDYGLKSHVYKHRSAAIVTEQQTSHSPERSSTWPWGWISMMSPSSVIHGGRLTGHECHTPDKQIHYVCTSDFSHTINTYIQSCIHPCMYAIGVFTVQHITWQHLCQCHLCQIIELWTWLTLLFWN